MPLHVDQKKTCVADSRIQTQFKDMFGNQLMFCYEFASYIPEVRCNSRSDYAQCSKFKSISDFKKEAGVSENEQ